MYECYSKRLLRINLTLKTYTIEPISDEYIEKYIGGIGFGTEIVFREVPPTVDAFDEKNKITINVGPINGTRAPLFAQSCIVTKSPASNGMVNSYAGGDMAYRIKQSGFDSIIIEGRSDQLVYVLVDENGAQFYDANQLKGKTTDYTEDHIKSIHGKELGVISIGLAGENMVRFAACISNTRAYGRGGVGGVFGSKNLKAIAMKGNKDIKVNDPEGFEKNVDKCIEIIERAFGDNWNLLASFGKNGTGSGLGMINSRNALATKNHKLSRFQNGDKIDGYAYMENYPTRLVACHACAVHCGQVHRFEKGKFPGMVTRGPEYETMYSFGSDILNDDREILAKAHQICEEYGMDTLSAGCTVAFAMECYEKGLIDKKDTGGIDLKFGNNEEMIRMLEKIGKRENIGNLLAEGTRRASQKIGKGSEGFAMQVKGLEFAAWMPQRMKGVALTFATSNRGACHKRAPVGLEITGKIPMDSIQNKPELVKEIQDKVNALFTLVCCRFAEFEYPMGLFLDLLTSASGIRVSEEEFVKKGEMIWNMERMFNIESGMSKSDDWLPERCFEALTDIKEPFLPLTEKDLTNMLDRYYELRGWDSQGIPKKETLDILGIVR
ncbi:aldehyde ferredoxin oxidoreductase family protein [Alkaliphilus peptidifermentans]|uniref:Aldehyde:ferredoxin oxidoreductase n=1 Tax=Alkaliphilus peptidifermentans DSM 18978 TaxID=1120976 RepID=A0A1G5CUI8_9FIRM|nr:aldehyde ferredoxin oxidoreductase family protein [Alkaliphilus peptidifermentans]SCY05870.1 aldehyde:ferredoxin oxidoreductase [Alkaliphilus peptidifermentans DSM 18978]